MTIKRVRIGTRLVGEGTPCFIVAEVSANHNQSFVRAVQIICAAKQAGADAIKLQTYTPDTLTINSDREWFQIRGDSPWAGKNLYQLYSEAYTPWEWFPRLREVALGEGLDWFSTPFDATAVDFLETLAPPAYKIASFELVHLPLLRRIAQTRRPVIASTGMASLSEIEEAVRTLRAHGTTQLALLKCTGAYPAPPAGMNLRTIPHLAQTFGVVAGLSDHTPGGSVAVAAVALGACIIEKHLTLRRADGGPDSSFSMEPEEFSRMVSGIRQAEQAPGAISYELTPEEMKSLIFRRSLFVVEDVKQGDPFTRQNVRVIRPGYGMHPRYLPEVLGRRAAADILRGTPLGWGLVG